MDPLKTSSYDYRLPEELIATHPVTPRENARLLVYDRQNHSITHTHFYDINTFLPHDAALIFNDTKVIKARLFGTKLSGGKIELLINRPRDAYVVSVYIRGRVKIGTQLFFDANLQAEVLALYEDGSRDVRFTCNATLLRYEAVVPLLDAIGHIPLPPYINREDTAEDTRDYQSVFARYEGAVAAPTASLHFSDALFETVTSAHEHAFVTLHVGAGTFKPVEVETITDHPMHSEYFSVSKPAQTLLDSSQNIVAFGTTATRTIEFYARSKQTSGEANLFLHPHNPPMRVNHLLTNFHLPRSTLLMLVASFVGLEETLRIYESAVHERYRFFSYGDAMLVL